MAPKTRFLPKTVGEIANTVKKPGFYSAVRNIVSGCIGMMLTVNSQLLTVNSQQ